MRSAFICSFTVSLLGISVTPHGHNTVHYKCNICIGMVA